MGYSPLLRGRVQGLSRGVNVPNAQPDASGLASVNPIFTFVRLAQRVPVRIRIDEVPDGIKLVAGLTATVEIEPFKAAPPAPAPTPGSEPVTKAEPKPAPSQVAAPAGPQLAAAPGAPAPTLSRAPAEAARSQASAQPVPQAGPPQATGPVAPVRGLGELAVSAPPSPEASAAAGAAAADLKTLEEQIASNPPSGSAAPSTAGNRRTGTSADMMSSSEYLGQTYDLEGGQSATPAPKPRSPARSAGAPAPDGDTCRRQPDRRSCE